MNDAVEILLVEDNPADHELTLRALRLHNLANAVTVAEDGAEALAYFFDADGRAVNGHRPRLVILDLKLPKVSGLDVLHRIKADEATRTIPVVVLTSSQQERDLLESYALGVSSYIVKPVDFAQLIAAADEIGMYWLLLNKEPS